MGPQNMSPRVTCQLVGARCWEPFRSPRSRGEEICKQVTTSLLFKRLPGTQNRAAGSSVAGVAAPSTG